MVLPSTLSPLLRRPGVHPFYDLGEGGPNLLTCRQAVPHSPYEVAMHPHRLLILLISCLPGHIEAHCRGPFEVALEGVAARKKVLTLLA